MNEGHPRNKGEEPVNKWFVGGYLAPALVVLFTIFWVLTAYWLIGWRERDWSFGTLPYIPAQSAFTTRPYPSGKVPQQVQLPPREQGGKRATR